MSEHDERRRFRRIMVERPARLITGAGDMPVQVVDISLHGALLQPDTRNPEAVDGAATLIIELGGDMAIEMGVRPVHHEGTYVGVRCEHLPVDSAAHLRRLVELNLGDPYLLERELAALASVADPGDAD